MSYNSQYYPANSNGYSDSNTTTGTKKSTISNIPQQFSSLVPEDVQSDVHSTLVHTGKHILNAKSWLKSTFGMAPPEGLNKVRQTLIGQAQEFIRQNPSVYSNEVISRAREVVEPSLNALKKMGMSDTSILYLEPTDLDRKMSYEGSLAVSSCLQAYKDSQRPPPYFVSTSSVGSVVDAMKEACVSEMTKPALGMVWGQAKSTGFSIARTIAKNNLPGPIGYFL